MFIFFHGAVFDPAEIILAEASEINNGVYIQIHGASQSILVTSDSKKPLALLGELYQIMLETGIAYSADDDLDIELDGDEIEMLDGAQRDGFSYIARDKDGKIFAYWSKPIKRAGSYEDISSIQPPRRLEDDYFSEITFETGPISIAYLLVPN